MKEFQGKIDQLETIIKQEGKMQLNLKEWISLNNMNEFKTDSKECRDKISLQEAKNPLKETEYQINHKIKMNLSQMHHLMAENRGNTKLLNNKNKEEEENINNNPAQVENNIQDMKGFPKRENNKPFPR